MPAFFIDFVLPIHFGPAPSLLCSIKLILCAENYPGITYLIINGMKNEKKISQRLIRRYIESRLLLFGYHKNVIMTFRP